ncbi:uncharacterized protein LOC121344378 [Onychostruthus taczanowskii]|uniref:uncharacterized protein LOC121344378 n=1 Tax=Onychostruthus taczanowskii TaxID=356909 RepID=UPI001B8022D9|nr:uncharacterized protein LOC121344378 [Onychostruthus taczanowskii]
MALLSPTELAGHCAGCARGGSPVPREEEHSWAQLPGSRDRLGHWSSSSSVCTEDFAVSFWEGMVEPLLCQQEPAGDVPTAGAHPGQDEPLFPTGRSLDTAMEPGRAPRQDRSPSRSSLESLGARISRLSQSHGGVAWGVPWPGPPAQPALGHRDSAPKLSPFPTGSKAGLLPGHCPWEEPGRGCGVALGSQRVTPVVLQRLRELERGSRSLLRQRLRVLQRLHGLLRRDQAETLRQLREALEQDRAGSGVRREHLRSRPRDPAVPGRAGGSPGLGNPPLAPRGHGLRPCSAVGPGPSPAAFGSSPPSPSRALHVLRGLRQQIQRRLGQWQRLEGALGAAEHRKEVIWDWEEGHGVHDSISPWGSPHCHPRGNASPSAAPARVAGSGASRVPVPCRRASRGGSWTRPQLQELRGSPWSR